MNIGELDKRIKLINVKKTIINENGFPVKEKPEVKIVWASVRNLSGKEFFAASTIKKERILKFKIRYIQEIDNNTVIDFRGKKFDIISIDNIDFKNKFLEIRGKVVSNE